MLIAPIDAPLGAQIDGLDLREPPPEATQRRLRQALSDHLVLVLRGQPLDEQTQHLFAACFGRPAPIRSGPTKDEASPHVLLVANVTEPGTRSVLGDGGMDFHMDQCYTERPVNATTLHALEVPTRGGDTVFINGYLAYEALPESKKSLIDTLKGVNVYDTERNVMRRVAPPRPDAPAWVHPLVVQHPGTGRRSIFFNRLMTDRIEGMPYAESRDLLGELFELTEQERFMYRHRWQVGDLLIWNNRFTLHGRTDFDPAERRKLRRIAVHDDTRPSGCSADSSPVVTPREASGPGLRHA